MIKINLPLNFLNDLFNSGIEKVSDEVKDLFNNSFEKYIDNRVKEFSRIKTLLYRETSKNFHSIYLPAELKLKNKIISTENIDKLFKGKFFLMKNRFITVIGSAGSGKTMLLKYLFLNVAQNYKEFKPMFIEFRDLNNHKGTIEEYIRDEILEAKLVINQNILERLLRNGKFIFFLDGFDEIVSKKEHNITKDLKEFINKYNQNYFLITSRPYTTIESFMYFDNYKMQNLSNEEIKKFINKQDIEQTVKSEIINSIETSKQKKQIEEFLTNPLLLTLFIITFEVNSSIPEKKSIFYQRVIEALFFKHDSYNKGAFKRELRTKLSKDKFEWLLQRFSYLSYFDGKFNFSDEYVNQTLNKIKKDKFNFENRDFIYDLKVSIGLWQEDSGELSFSHRSLQEYFIALYEQSLNYKQKKKFFEKFNLLLHKRNESENLFKLIEEIDKLNYYKYFYLNILEEIYEIIKIKDVNIIKQIFNFYIVMPNLINKSFLVLHSNTLNIKDFFIKNKANNFIGFDFNDESLINKLFFIYINGGFETYKIKSIDIIENNFEKEKFIVNNCKESYDYNEYIRGQNYYIKNEDIFAYVTDNGFEEIKIDINNFFKQIESELERTKKFIKESEDFDNELLD